MGGYFDQTISSLAAINLAQSATQTNKEDFFRNNYTVCSEKVLDDIPQVVLVNLATRTGLLGRDIILNLLGEKRSTKLRRNIIYQFFDKFLQLFY